MKQGFTLLELSIVLVIIGLIIGGITVGADMIRSAELNSVVSEITKYKTAINTYKLKYNALPGDHKNAEAYWGQAATGAACLTAAGTGTQTCNGDGDGKVDYVSSALANPHESWRAWEHLSNSEIIAGNYIGISITGCTSPNYCTDAGNNAPPSKAASASAWHIFSPEPGWQGKDSVRNVLALGNPSNLTGSGSNGEWHGLVLSPQDMKTIDTKADDGSPNTGKITNMNAGNGTIGALNANCVTGTGGSMEYNLLYGDIACNLFADFD